MQVTTRLAPKGLEIVEYDRRFYLDNVWEYNPGERVSILGPSGAGKGVLGFQLLEVTATPKIQPVYFATKGRDETIEEWSKGLGYKRIPNWPPRFNPFESTPPLGYVLWPPEDPESYHNTLQTQSRVFLRALNDIYNFHKKQKRRPKDRRLDGMIVVVDEMSELCEEMNLDDQAERFYRRGRSMLAGMWGESQLPIGLPGVVYSSADHLFLAYMPDERYRKRFAEIGGGIDSKLIEETTLRLPQYWWLYIRRADRTMCIVRA
jgi:ABC-type dipeptide/oligopeptide/nickel transport system ATPase component